MLTALYGHKPLEIDDVVEEVWQFADEVSGCICDTRVLLYEKLAEGADILLEGAQGTFLDLDYGTYPYVTSSHPVAGGACLGTGVGPTAIDRVIIVAKGYSTRVGAGPFPTELDDEAGDIIRDRGQEYGTTTGRPRRCGWLDGVALRTSAQINGATDIALMLLDVLDVFATLKVCTAYEIEGVKHTIMPSNSELLRRATPIREELPGWQCSVSDVIEYEDLPAAARCCGGRPMELEEPHHQRKTSGSSRADNSPRRTVVRRGSIGPTGLTAGRLVAYNLSALPMDWWRK